MPVALAMQEMVQRQSWIRKMFEEGAKLKAELGAENVFDFSLGNPDVPPPTAFKETLKALANDPATPHGYMPNSGYPAVRQAVANYLAQEQGVPLALAQVVMVSGAAGGLNTVFRALLNPGEEVVCPAPYFVEYNAYVGNHGGVLKTVPSRPDFSLDLAGLDKACNEKTRAVLINSPNNPTGVVYGAAEIAALGEMLEKASRRLGRRIYLVSDEPYRKIVYDGVKVPSVLAAYPHSVVVSSYSKDLSLAGERLGFVAVNPAAEDAATLVEVIVLANRILGYVNAPSLIQLAVARIQGESVDPHIYQRRRDRLYGALSGMGYQVVKPQGAFYLFPRSPLADDVKFVGLLKEERVLVVPGSGFGGPGHFRISYAVPEATIEKSLAGFERALKKT